MSFIEIMILAIALSIDASIASLAQGTILTLNKRKYSFLLALSMAIFQAFMPILGWIIALNFIEFIKEFDHWIAFIVFLILGLKLIKEAYENKDEDRMISCITIPCILSLSFATSIDALVAGATLSFLNVDIIKPSILIGITTFFAALGGFWAGYMLKKVNKFWLEIFGGALLIVLGLKVLIEHLFFS